MATHVWNKGTVWKHFLQTKEKTKEKCLLQKFVSCRMLSQNKCYSKDLTKTQSCNHAHRHLLFGMDKKVTQKNAQISIAVPVFMKSIRKFAFNHKLSVPLGKNTYSMENNKKSDFSENNSDNAGILHTMFNKEQADDKSDSSSQGEAKKESEEQESAFLKNQRYAKWFLLGSILIITPVFVLRNGQPKYNEHGEVIEDEFSKLPVVLAYAKRSWSEMKLVKKDIVEPSSKKLLPDPLVEPYYQPPYTLVLELMDVFLRPVYDSVTGWRFKKRPGIDYFLSQVGPPMFEVVIFTRETGMTAYPLIDSMDSKGYIMYRLFRDAARYKSGFSIGNLFQGDVPKLDPYYQKDLRYLNRDLSKVIIVDCDKRAFEKQPENGLCLDKWDGSTHDSTLYDLSAFLKTIATSEVDDVRPVLKHYSAYSHPLEAFKLAQARMQEDIEMNQSAKNTQMFVGTGNAISSFFRRR